MKHKLLIIGGISAFIMTGHLNAAVILALDFNSNTGVAVTQTGFDSYLLDPAALPSQGTVRTFGDYTVTARGVAGTATQTIPGPTGFQGTSNQLDDRDRLDFSGGGALTFNDLYRDFIFALDRNNGGMDITIDGLMPDSSYSFEIWSYDPSSLGGNLGARQATVFPTGQHKGCQLQKTISFVQKMSRQITTRASLSLRLQTSMAKSSSQAVAMLFPPMTQKQSSGFSSTACVFPPYPNLAQFFWLRFRVFAYLGGSVPLFRFLKRELKSPNKPIWKNPDRLFY